MKDLWTERTGFHLPVPAGSLAGAGEKRLDIGGELGVMLEQEAVRRVGVDLHLGSADSGVVERHDPPGRCQRVDQRGVPVVQVSAEVLEQDQRHLALAAGVAVGVVDAVGRADQLVRQLRISRAHNRAATCRISSM